MPDNKRHVPPIVSGPLTSKDPVCVRVTRTTSFADRFRAYRILIDGHEAASIPAGQTVDLSVPPGPHTIVAKVDWCGSPTRHFDVDAGKTVQFECGSNLPGLRVFLAMIYVFFLNDEYLTLDQVGSVTTTHDAQSPHDG